MVVTKIVKLLLINKEIHEQIEKSYTQSNELRKSFKTSS